MCTSLAKLACATVGLVLSAACVMFWSAVVALFLAIDAIMGRFGGRRVIPAAGRRLRVDLGHDNATSRG